MRLVKEGNGGSSFRGAAPSHIETYKIDKFLRGSLRSLPNEGERARPCNRSHGYLCVCDVDTRRNCLEHRGTVYESGETERRSSERASVVARFRVVELVSPGIIYPRHERRFTIRLERSARRRGKPRKAKVFHDCSSRFPRRIALARLTNTSRMIDIWRSFRRELGIMAGGILTSRRVEVLAERLMEAGLLF